MTISENAIIQSIAFENPHDVQLFIKREDLLHPFISGNKYRKLKYNILEAQLQNKTTLLTFGGAYSNHIAATAYAGKAYHFKTIGIIRGEELQDNIDENATLQFAKSCGMQLVFVSREAYRTKTEQSFLLELQKDFGNFYLIPEGGTNALAVKGCEEICTPDDARFQYVCCAVGTGGTISGLINAAQDHQKILGFPALKGHFLQQDICKFATKDNWQLVHDYHFGGYAKITPQLVAFINTFKRQFGVPLDPIYTGKMMFGLCGMINEGYFEKGSEVLAIHTGGLQGIAGMNSQLKRKQLPLLDL